eukprot:scaffold46660_cov199-Amphora_coffeaeformis.AAC.3
MVPQCGRWLAVVVHVGIVGEMRSPDTEFGRKEVFRIPIVGCIAVSTVKMRDNGRPVCFDRILLIPFQRICPVKRIVYGGTCRKVKVLQGLNGTHSI